MAQVRAGKPSIGVFALRRKRIEKRPDGIWLEGQAFPGFVTQRFAPGITNQEIEVAEETLFGLQLHRVVIRAPTTGDCYNRPQGREGPARVDLPCARGR